MILCKDCEHMRISPGGAFITCKAIHDNLGERDPVTGQMQWGQDLWTEAKYVRENYCGVENPKWFKKKRTLMDRIFFRK